MTEPQAPLAAPPPRARGIFCNRTLNLRSISAVGYDMDYTLIHYRVEEWEKRAYQHIQQRLEAAGWPVAELRFDAGRVTRGLILDLEKGNLCKANRFGFVKRAFHGTRPLEFDAQRTEYSRTQVDLSQERWVFINTLFSLSEACMYAQLVDLLDEQKLPGVMGYRDLYQHVRKSLDAAHMEGQLKAEIMANPDRFVELDPELPLTLLDQKGAGKKLLLITNSEWEYTSAMMAYAFDRFLPSGVTWRSLFHLVMVSARKPEFFNSRQPVHEVMVDSGLLKPVTGTKLRDGAIHHGGCASLVETHLGVSGDDILYVGDHMFTDVHISKSALRWRTALILRELEDEVRAEDAFLQDAHRLQTLMNRKEALEFSFSQYRLHLQRARGGYGPPSTQGTAELERHMGELRAQLLELDAQIAPLAKASAQLFNPHWGPLLRAGNDKSHLARQVERYADIYMSRVSNFLAQTPFLYLRSPRGSLPHDPPQP